MKTSVITIGKTKKECLDLKDKLKSQTFKDYEFVYSTKKGIPQAWNDAIRKAKGEILVFTETDACPLNRGWLKKLIKGLNPDFPFVARGVEIRPQPWNMSSFVCHRRVFDKHKFDESFERGEDTELFARLLKDGYFGIQIMNAFVVHNPSRAFSIKNGYKTGFSLGRIRKRYGHTGFTNYTGSSGNFIVREVKAILNRVAFMLGIFLGTIYEVIRRKWP